MKVQNEPNFLPWSQTLELWVRPALDSAGVDFRFIRAMEIAHGSGPTWKL